MTNTLDLNHPIAREHLTVLFSAAVKEMIACQAKATNVNQRVGSDYFAAKAKRLEQAATWISSVLEMSDPQPPAHDE